MDRKKKVLKKVNRHLKVFGEAVGANFKLTFYAARHTYATVLKRSGVATSMISEALGHSNEKITQVYLDSFGKEVLDEVDQALL
jgi:integrase